MKTNTKRIFFDRSVSDHNRLSLIEVIRSIRNIVQFDGRLQEMDSNKRLNMKVK